MQMTIPTSQTVSEYKNSSIEKLVLLTKLITISILVFNESCLLRDRTVKQYINSTLNTHDLIISAC